MYNRNRLVTFDPRYVQQQRVLKEVCDDLGLVPFYPNYHASAKDNNTVLIYTKEAAEHNSKIDQFEKEHGYRPEEDMPQVCYLENTDLNGQFSLGFFNRARLVVVGLDDRQLKEKLTTFIRGRM